MKNRNPKTGKRKMDSGDESSDEDGSANEDNSYPIVTVEDSEDTGSHKASSESEEGTSSDTSSEIQVRAKKRKLMRPNELLSDSSDSGDETCEKCAICLRSILSQEVGSPEGCDHLFCSVCIIEWSKNSNVCPLDRQQFSIILVRKSKNGNVVKQLSVEEPKPLNIYDEDEDDTYCEVCGESDREERMLLCDGCQRGFHIECLTPPLEEVPLEEEWFCPNCRVNSSLDDTSDILDNIDEELNQLVRHQRVRGSLSRSGPRGRSRTGTRIRTLLLERIRVAVNRIVRSCFLDADDDDDDDDEDEDEDFEAYEAESESESEPESDDSLSEESIASANQPGTSGTQRKTKKASTSTKKRKTKRRKRSTKKATTKRKTKKRSTKKKKTGTKRKAKSKSTVRTKRVKIQNADGTVKIVKTRTYKRRRKQKVKKKVKTAASLRRSSGNSGTPKTVKGRLALTLGMVPPKRPGQLLPDVKIRSSRNEISGIDINRARAGIPRLHIFEPRHELQLFSSGSDGEGFAGDDTGPVATLTQPRIMVSSIRDRKRAALLLQSTPTVSLKSKPVVDDPPKEIDILSSILDSQAIWHSKNTDVKIREDGSIEILKKAEKIDKKSSAEENKGVDVKGTTPEGAITQAPMYPGSSSRPGAFRQYNRTSFGESRGSQDNSLSARSSVNQSSVGFSRFGSAPRNDREGYANYLNNMPQGPIPFCRGGPPLRFRMPSRQQLRRFPFPPRINRSPWQNAEEDGENEPKNSNSESQSENNPAESKKTDEDDVDLYSDIETNAEKADSPEREEGSGTSYPALGPPPEPSAFLLGIDENGDVVEKKNASEVYDPAEPCDSEDEMVIDENVEKVSSPSEERVCGQEVTPINHKAPSPSPSEAKSPKQSCQRGSTEDEDDECPIFSIYSSASREFSQKEEEEREREIAEEKRKLEAMERREEKAISESIEARETNTTNPSHEQPDSKETNEGGQIQARARDLSRKRSKSKERSGNRLSFDMEKGDDKCPSQDDEDSIGSRSCPSQLNASRSRSGTPRKCLFGSEHSGKSPLERSRSNESEKARGKSSSADRSTEKTSRRRSRSGDSDSDADSKKRGSDDDEDDDDKTIRHKVDKNIESESESVQTKVATGLEGLDVEEVSSDNGDGDDFVERRSLSSLSLSELSNRSQESTSRLASRKKKKRKRRKGLRKIGKKYDDGGGDHEDEKEKVKGNSSSSNKVENEDIENEGQGEKHRRRKSNSAESDRQILGNKENKKDKSKEKDKDLSWKKPSKKEKNYREGKKRSKERGRSRSKDRRKSRSCSPKKDKKKNKDRKKKSEKKKEIERYDVRKIVKNKEIRKTDAFGRDLISKSRSISRSRSRSPIRERSRNMLRRDSRSYTRSRSRSYRRGRSPVRRRYLRSRTKSRSKSPRRSFSRSRSRSRSVRKSKKKFKSKERLKGRSRSRGRKSRSRRRSLSRSRSRSPLPRMQRGKRPRSRRSWSHHSRSLSFSTRRSRSFSRSPVRVRRSYTRSASSSWSRGRSPMPRATSLEKLTVVLKTKDKKKGKKKKEGKKGKREEERRKKIGNSKEVFASGDNVLVSVNFRNNNNTSSNNNNGSVTNETGRNARMDSSSPAPSSDRKKRRGSDYEVERVSKKSKKSSTISKNVVDMALSNSCSKRVKKLTRLSEKDAEVILNRKPVAVIDLDLSPYREQTPSPINVVVVSDSGSGDEGKEQTPQRQAGLGSPSSEVEKNKESADTQSANVSVPSSPVANGYLTGPKTPPEPQIKFSISKPQQLRQIANPLGDDDDEEDAEEDEEQEFKRIESLDRRIEKELDNAHKGPNTPPEPRGPTTPKTPPSPQTSPDAYDPFEPTKSRSPTPSQDKENRKSPPPDQKDDQATVSEISVAAPSVVSEVEPTSDSVSESQEEKPVAEVVEKGEAIPVLEPTAAVATTVQPCTPVPETRKEDSPERKISVVITSQQSKIQPQTQSQKPYTPVLKPISMVQTTSSSTPPVSGSLTTPFTSFSLPSPTKTTRAGGVTTSQPVQMSGIQRLQHRLGSPVNRTPNSVKSTPEKRLTPRTEPSDMTPAGTYRTGSKRNGEQVKQARPLQDATNETIDMTVDMDDSPYSPASSEGDDLFDPPMEPTKPAQTNPKVVQPGYKPPQSKAPHKSPIKQLSKFDLLFGPSGPTLSPLKVASKKPKANAKPSAQPKPQSAKPAKKNTNSKRGVSLKMDEDQLRILDELPSSAVELHVKDKFLKKLNRQERVVDEVKTVLKPHYARKHITKEEYKDILRRSVPKICHSRSGEINPSKIQSLIEAYVKKFRHAKKKGASSNAVVKAKTK